MVNLTPIVHVTVLKHHSSHIKWTVCCMHQLIYLNMASMEKIKSTIYVDNACIRSWPLSIGELNNPAGSRKKMRDTSTSRRSSILKLWATMPMTKLPLQRGTTMSVTNGSFSYTKKHTTCSEITNRKWWN